MIHEKYNRSLQFILLFGEKLAELRQRVGIGTWYLLFLYQRVHNIINIADRNMINI